MLVDRPRVAVAWLTALVALVALGGCGWSGETAAVSDLGGADDDGYRGALLAEGDRQPVPAVALSDTDGEAVDLATEPGRAVVFFGFTRCTTICPVVLSTLARAVALLPEAQRGQVEVLFVTTDPAYDTAEVLRRHLDRFDPAFRGVRGSTDDVAALADALQVRLDDGRGTVAVSVADGRADLLWSHSTTPAAMADDLERILREDP